MLFILNQYVNSERGGEQCLWRSIPLIYIDVRSVEVIQRNLTVKPVLLHFYIRHTDWSKIHSLYVI